MMRDDFKVIKCGMCRGHVNYAAYGGFCSIKCANVAFRLIKAKMGKKHPRLDEATGEMRYDDHYFGMYGDGAWPLDDENRPCDPVPQVTPVGVQSTTGYNGSRGTYTYTPTKRKVEVAKVWEGTERPASELVLPSGYASFVQVEAMPVSVSPETPTQQEVKVDVTKKTNPKPKIFEMATKSERSNVVNLVPLIGDAFA